MWVLVWRFNILNLKSLVSHTIYQYLEREKERQTDRVVPFYKLSPFGYLASFGAFSKVVSLGVFFHWMRLCGEFLGSFLAFLNLVPVNVILSWLLCSFVCFYMATFLTCFLITCCHGCHIAIYNFLWGPEPV